MHEFLKSGEALGQAVSPHAGELSVGEQRGGFTGLRLCRRLPHQSEEYHTHTLSDTRHLFEGDELFLDHFKNRS